MSVASDKIVQYSSILAGTLSCCSAVPCNIVCHNFEVTAEALRTVQWCSKQALAHIIITCHRLQAWLCSTQYVAHSSSACTAALASLSPAQLVPAAAPAAAAAAPRAVFDAPATPDEDIYSNPPSIMNTLQEQLQSDINDPALRYGNRHNHHSSSSSSSGDESRACSWLQQSSELRSVPACVS